MRACLERHGDLASRLMLRIVEVMICLIQVMNLLTTSPWPSKYFFSTESVAPDSMRQIAVSEDPETLERGEREQKTPSMILRVGRCQSHSS